NRRKLLQEDVWLTQIATALAFILAKHWTQYFVNDRFYKTGGPVFLMIGGEGPANPAWMQYGTWLNYAEKFGALCLLLEHRFYGKSHPTERLVADVLDLGIWHIPQSSLAAWKYIVTEYLEVVQKSLEAENPQCPVLVKKASDTLMARLNDPKTYDNITKDFRASFIIMRLMAVLGTNITIKVLCDVMLDSSLGEPYDRYAAVARLLQKTFLQSCTDVQYSQYVREMSNTSWTGPAASGGVYLFIPTHSFIQSTDIFTELILQFVLLFLHTHRSTLTLKCLLVVLSINKKKTCGKKVLRCTAHCANMYPARAEDLPALTQARDEIFLLLQQWLKK
uniref:Serine protease 16 n=1 Tax=Astyanax mexicanus TaxID=7994 RepID=A0A8B9GSL3_ASTMX